MSLNDVGFLPASIGLGGVGSQSHSVVVCLRLLRMEW